jgi:L-threonine kinase
MQSLLANKLAVTRAKAPGTCGELMQGAIDGHDFLVNCPINLFSHAELEFLPSADRLVGDLNAFSKIRDAVNLLSDHYDIELGHRISVWSDIPRGKGMASSSADISAALECVCKACELAISPQQLAWIVTEIEPSDCVHFPGIAHVNHLTGELLESMPAPENLRVLAVDCGGEIDTIAFDRERARAVYRQRQGYLREALRLLKCGLRDGDARSLAEAATRSAELSQSIHYKPQFADLVRCTREVGALGVNCAHSGTVLGVLYRGSSELEERLYKTIFEAFGSDLTIVGAYQIIGGGCHEW